MLWCRRRARVCGTPRRSARSRRAVSFLLLLVNGVAIAFVSNTSYESMQKFCTAPTADQGFVVQQVRAVLDSVDKRVVDFVNINMCSDACPCQTPTNAALWTGVAADQLVSYGRKSKFVFNNDPSSLTTSQ